MDKICNRIMISACGSGSGKTTLMMAVLASLIRKNIKVQSFKCGPDYIDPMYHSKITGRPTYHTDPFFLDNDKLRGLVADKSRGADISVIEGAMGFYDGLGTSDSCSAYSVARITKTPVLLAIDPKGMGCSVGALCRGFLEYREDNNISGVILNRIKPGMYEYYKSIIEENSGLRVYGYLPELDKVTLRSRHLGLNTADEINNFSEITGILSDMALRTLDLDGMLELSKQAEPLVFNDVEEAVTETVTLAVAKDRAFCFYYDENIEILKRYGAKIVTFSPVDDEKLPEDIDGIYLGGGYPELYAEKLAGNKSFLSSIRAAVRSGIPLFGECGGFLYLNEMIEGEDGKNYEMTGILHCSSHMEKRPVRFGYITLTAERDTLLLKKGETILGHEFHYADSTDNGDAVIARKPNGIKWRAIHQSGNVMAGFPHLYLPSCPQAAERFVYHMQEYKKRRAENK